jgi:hypothetical protein
VFLHGICTALIDHDKDVLLMDQHAPRQDEFFGKSVGPENSLITGWTRLFFRSLCQGSI